MSYITCVLCLCSIFVSMGKSLEMQPILDATNKQDTRSPLEIPKERGTSVPFLVGNKPKLEFPKKSDASTPILIGNDPKQSNLPPRVFPSQPLDKSISGPSIVSGTNINVTEINHNNEQAKLNLTNDKTLGNTNTPLSPLLENVEKTQTSQEANDKTKFGNSTPEQEDMLHTKYSGGQDVDELKPEKKASEKDEKKPVTPKRDPKSEVHISPTLDKTGPKSMNESKAKSGETMLESTSKMMAVSSSVLANTQPKEHGIIEPAKTVASVLLTAVALLCFGAIGLLVWKRIAMRRFGRDVLINEDDFDEVADMHTFDRAQIQIT